jgi:hypothetical protein
VPLRGEQLAFPASYGRCRVLLAFHVDEGDIDGVEVRDATVAMLADTPAQMSDGGSRVGLFLDDSTSEEQREGLQAVFSGAQGGAAGGRRAGRCRSGPLPAARRRSAA